LNKYKFGGGISRRLQGKMFWMPQCEHYARCKSLPKSMYDKALTEPEEVSEE